MAQMTGARALLEAFGDGSDSRVRAAAARAVAVVFVAALTAAAAQVSVSIPLTAIPFTMQPMVVLLGGVVLGPRLGAAAQILYLSAGIAGFPVFAFSPTLPYGPARLLGPTGGYLMSYPIAAFVAGWLSSRGHARRYISSVVAMLAGLLVVYTCGVVWLAWFTSTAVAAPSAVGAALAAGVYPFVIADVLKVLAAAAVAPALWRLVPPRRT